MRQQRMNCTDCIGNPTVFKLSLQGQQSVGLPVLYRSKTATGVARDEINGEDLSRNSVPFRGGNQPARFERLYCVLGMLGKVK